MFKGECRKSIVASWDVFHKARKECLFGFNTFMTKWISGDTATCRVMHIREKRSHANCPRCNAPDDHTTHVLQYQPVDTYIMRLDILTEFRVWLCSVLTYPDIDTFMYNGIKS